MRFKSSEFKPSELNDIKDENIIKENIEILLNQCGKNLSLKKIKIGIYYNLYIIKVY